MSVELFGFDKLFFIPKISCLKEQDLSNSFILLLFMDWSWLNNVILQCSWNALNQISSSRALMNTKKWRDMYVNWYKCWYSAVFNYNPSAHNVVSVNKAGYNTCSVPRGGSRVYNTGRDQIRLVKGLNFFICSVAGHCQSGMKIAITAI